MLLGFKFRGSGIGNVVVCEGNGIWRGFSFLDFGVFSIFFGFECGEDRENWNNISLVVS